MTSEILHKFVLIEGHRYKCKTCENVVAAKSTSNLWAHYRTHGESAEGTVGPMDKFAEVKTSVVPPLSRAVQEALDIVVVEMIAVDNEALLCSRKARVSESSKSFEPSIHFAFKIHCH